LKCHLDQVKELYVLRPCPFPLSRRHNSSFSTEERREKKKDLSALVETITGENQISWRLRREMQMHMSKTSNA